jgi:hypothetical protein
MAFGKICMKGRDVRKNMRNFRANFGLSADRGSQQRSPALIYQPPAGPPGGLEQQALVTEAISEGHGDAIVEMRAPHAAIRGMPAVQLCGPQICSMQICSPARGEGSEAQGDRGDHRQHAFA